MMARLREGLASHLSSVRARTTVLTTVTVAIALTVTAVVVVRLQREALTDNVETAIRLRADDISGMIASGRLPQTLEQNDAEVAAVQVLDGRGAVVSSTANLQGEAPMDAERPVAGVTKVGRIEGLPMDDEPFLLLSRTVEGGDGQLYLMNVAGSMEGVQESTETLYSTFLIGVPVLVLGVAAGTWWVVGRTLAPVEGMRREVESIGAGKLDHRVAEPRVADEVGRLARTMNGMLARLQEANAEQERFVADAAHELRSPLASLRTQIETRAAGGGSSDADTLEEVTRLQSLVDDLLLLARGARTQREDKLLDLDDIVLAEVARRSADGVRVDTRHVSGGQVRGDASQLGRAVRNLLENAALYANREVSVSLGEEEREVVLVVADDGPGVPEEDRERIFERFVRLDSARSRRSGGTGLGLAIVRSIASAHGGSVELDGSRGGGATFILRLPRPDV